MAAPSPRAAAAPGGAHPREAPREPASTSPGNCRGNLFKRSPNIPLDIHVIIYKCFMDILTIYM